MPLLAAKPGQVPDEHEDECPCLLCEAGLYLTTRDWLFVRFYQSVAQQVNCLTPMGDSDGKLQYGPRVTDWIATARMLGYPDDDHEELVAFAALILDGISGRLKGQMRDHPIEEYAPPEEEEWPNA